ncbi:MAG TPA: TetR/AcrR family transcriptional regulator [Rhizomicrobium sp.]|nr:TetR/AcrR family transcriptional regulator [Rhizomicrobium sp.]
MTAAAPTLKPRKSPLQARSAATIETLHQAAIQVLTRDGIGHCTTTRIASRAGISVGSLYQYYPNRDALLAAVLRQHLDAVADAVEKTCRDHHGGPVATMAAPLVRVFLEAKLRDPAKSKALYAFGQARGGAQLASRHRARMVTAIATMLASAPDARFGDGEVTAMMMLGALMGPVQAVLEGRAPAAFTERLEQELTLLLSSYLQAHRFRRKPAA